MSRMCQNPGCPHLATQTVTVEDVSVALCYHCGKTARANLPDIEHQLRQHRHGAPCDLNCQAPATCQMWALGGWHNMCDRHRREMGEKLLILTGKAPEVRPLRTFFRETPEVRIEEIPPT